MPPAKCRVFEFASLGVLLTFSIAASVKGDDGSPRMPGQWDPVPETGSPSVVPVPIDQELHRPAMQIQAGPGARPAIVASVYNKPTLYGLTSSMDGRRLIALTYADTIDTRVVATLSGDTSMPGEMRGLAFNPASETVYGLFVGFPGYPGENPPSYICVINAETGDSDCAGIQTPDEPNATFCGLAFDSARDIFYTIMLVPEGPVLSVLPPSPPHYAYRLLDLPDLGSSRTITDLAFDAQADVLYAVYWSDTNPCRLVACSLDAGVIRTIDLTGPYASEPYKAAWDPCSGKLLCLGRNSSTLYSLDPVLETAPQLIGPIATNEPGVIAFWKPESWGLDYVAFNWEFWDRERIDNQQAPDWDPLWYWGDQRFHTCSAGQSPDLGRIDGVSFLYGNDGQPVVAWAQRVDNQFSEILVSARDARTGVWGPVGYNAYGVPSNKLPGISSTFAFATDPKILRARVNGQDTLVVLWLERFDSPTSSGEIYARYFDEGAGQWLEMGFESASVGGLTHSGGIVDSLDAVVLPAGNPADRRIVVAYSHFTDCREPIFVRTWNDEFWYWPEFSPGSADSATGISNPPDTCLDSHPAVAVGPDSGTLFIAWRRQTPGQPWAVMAKQWLGSLLDWHDVGYQGIIHRPAQAAATISRPAATFDKQFAVAWEQDLPPAEGKREVLAKVWQDGFWQEMGAGSSTSGGISGSYSVESVYPQLVTDPDLQPVITWDEGGSAYLRRFNQPLAQAADCNIDGVPDDVTIANCPPGDRSCADCNANGVPDACDIATGYSRDAYPGDFIPDECEQLPFGDLNCDRAVDAADIPHFVQALLDRNGYEETHNGYPFAPCQWMLADVNGDSRVDGEDVGAFVSVLLVR